VPILPLQIADLYFRTRNNNATAKLWITFAWLNRDYPDPPWVTYYQTTIAGNWAAWTSMSGILSVTAPAGARYLSFQMTVIEGTPSGQYFDIGDVQLRLH
jgi:hypothetical protein